MSELKDYREIYFSVWEFSSKEKRTPARYYLSSLPYNLCELVVKIGSRKGDLVLDPFCGSGQILLACRNLGRKVIGIDINPKAIEIAKSILYTSLLRSEGVRLILGDATEELHKLPDNYIDAVITHPPYWRAWRYTDKPQDLSRMEYRKYLEKMKGILVEIRRVLKDGKTLIIIAGDVIHKRKFYPLHAHLTVICEKVGFEPRPIGIWVLKDLAYYGYIRPYKIVRDGCFRQFQLSHNYILVFKR